jgi:hypothetical protein
MTKFTRFSAPVAILAAIAIPVFAQGCSAADELCCSDPTKLEVTGQAGAQFQVAVGAAADLAAVAQGSLDDVVSACRNMATDFDATSEELATAQAAQGNDAATAWCNLAVAKIKGVASANGNAKLTLKFDPPQCQASVSAKANCQAKCDVSGKCDIKANPPKCTGGKLEVSCKGSCKAEGSASVACEGSCGAECKGSCQATGGVKCEGKCEGTCEAEAGTAGSGIQADGTCKGTCKGTCEVTAPGVKCEGSCKGQCTGECKASANVAVKCDGKCDGDFEPLKCEGGKLEGGCQVDAKCDANCDASVSAKAECTPPQVVVAFEGGATINAKYTDSLKANLPQLIVVFQARGDAFVKTISTVGGSLAGSVSGDIGVKGIACLNTVGAQVVNASQQMTVAVSSSTNVVTGITK